MLAVAALSTPAAAQVPSCHTACAYGAVLEHLQESTDRALAMSRQVSTHDACAADVTACGVSLGSHDARVIDLLLARRLIEASYRIVGDSIAWDHPVDQAAPRATVRFAPPMEVPEFDPSVLPSGVEVLKAMDVSRIDAAWYRVGVVMNIGDDTTSYWYWVRRTADGLCEAVYKMVTGMA